MSQHNGKGLGKDSPQKAIERLQTLSGIGEVLALMKKKLEIDTEIENKMRALGILTGVDFDESMRKLKEETHE